MPDPTRNSCSQPEVVDIATLVAGVNAQYANFMVARTNDHVARISVMERDFHWHHHEYSDETFLVLEGTLLIDIADQTFCLAPGQMLTVPKGVQHRTRCKGRTVNLTFEHGETESVGDPA